MNQLITILSSSVVAALITAVFAYIQNRRTNSINYITGERKLWRDKIKTLAEDISKCKYHGTKDKDISVCLVRLQMNINTYGKVKKNDYIHDSHIWDIIDRIQKADSEESFEADKELLLYYISFMLKEDWERSKREIKGDFYKIGCIIIYILLSAIWAMFYFFILNLHDIGEFLTIEFTFLIPFILIAYLFNITDSILKYSKMQIVKRRINNNKRINIITGVVIFVIIQCLFSVGFWGSYRLPKRFVDNFEYSYDNNTMKICTHLNNSRFNGLEEILENSFDEKVVFVNYFDENTQLYRLPDELNNEIVDNVRKQICIFKIINGLFMIYVAASELSGIWIYTQIIKEKTRLRDAIHKITYSSKDSYIKDLFEANRVLEKIRQMDDNALHSQKCKLMLSFEYSLLSNVKMYINNMLADSDQTVSCLEECEEYIVLKDKQTVINSCIKIIKKVSGHHRIKKTRNLFNELEQQLSTIAICRIDEYN